MTTQEDAPQSDEKPEAPGAVDSEAEAEAEAKPAAETPKADAPPKARDGASKKKAKAEVSGETKTAEGLGPAPLFSLRAACGLALLSGFVCYAAFPPQTIWPMAFLSQAPLLLALRGQTPKNAAKIGMVVGFQMNVLGFYWLLNMLRDFSGFPTFLCVVFTGLVCAYQAGRSVLLSVLYVRAERRGWPPALVFTLGFVASELVYPLLFPWYVAASTHNVPLFMQVGDLGGPYLIGVVLVAPSLAVAELIAARLEKRPFSKGTLGAGVGITLFAIVYGFIRMDQFDVLAAKSEPIKVGIAQGNQPLLGRRNSLQVHFALTEALRDAGAELVVWSEGAVPITFSETGDFESVKQRFSSKLKVPAIFGAGKRRSSEGRPQHFNTAFMTAEDGTVLGHYDKQYLLAFGEYLPFGETFPVLYKWSPNSSRFSSGTSDAPLVWGKHRITALVCYEDILESFVNRVVTNADPDLIVNVTNDAWFGDTSEPWEHLALAQLRAVEHRRYLIRATNSGVSAFVDMNGRLLKRSDTFQEQAVMQEVRFMRAKTVYEFVGNGPAYLAAIAAVGLGFYSRKRAPTVKA